MKKVFANVILIAAFIIPSVVWGLTEDQMYSMVYDALGASLMGHPDEAMKMCDQVLAEKPDFAPALATRSNIKLNQKDTEGALADAKKAIELDPENKDVDLAYYVRALIALDNAAEPDKALEFITKAIDLRSVDPIRDYYELRAEIYTKLGNKASADADLAKVDALSPKE